MILYDLDLLAHDKRHLKYRTFLISRRLGVDHGTMRWTNMMSLTVKTEMMMVSTVETVTRYM